MSLWAELKRRNVIRIAAAYVVFGWVLLQTADIVLGFTGAPDWVGKALIALLLLGFVPTLVLAWVFEVGPDGIHFDDGTRARDSGPQARRLDMVTLGAVAVLMVLLAWQQLSGSHAPDAQPSSQAAESVRIAPVVEPLRAPLGTVAVLPFTNRSAEADTAYFVDGIHDDLLTELSRNGRLTVISRTSVMEYRDTTKNLRQIGEELGVAHVLEGAVQRAGRRVRINAQLIDAATDAHLWAETFDRELTPENIFEIQTEIATAIAQALGRALVRGDDTPPRSNVPTRDGHAFDLYLRARATRDDWTPEQIRARIELYREAVESDPQFALAMGELGREYVNLFWFTTRRSTEAEEGRRWLDRALALDPDNPQLRLALAEYHYRAHLDFDAALAELARAERGLPGSADALALRGYILRRKGDVRGTLEALNAAVLLDPRSVAIAGTVFETYWLMGDLESAQAAQARLNRLPLTSSYFSYYYEVALAQVTGNLRPLLDKRSSIDPANASGHSVFAGDAFYWPYLARDFERAAEHARIRDDFVEDQNQLVPRALMAALLARAQGRMEEAYREARTALGVLARVLDSHPDDYRALMARAQSQAILGDVRAARASADRALATTPVRRDVILHSELLRQRLLVLAVIADSPEVAAEMERYLQRELKYWDFNGLMLDPMFDAHRDHPTFQSLATKYSRQ